MLLTEHRLDLVLGSSQPTSNAQVTAEITLATATMRLLLEGQRGLWRNWLPLKRRTNRGNEPKALVGVMPNSRGGG
jgi:hypothetical protein